MPRYRDVVWQRESAHLYQLHLPDGDIWVSKPASSSSRGWDLVATTPEDSRGRQRSFSSRDRYATAEEAMGDAPAIEALLEKLQSVEYPPAEQDSSEPEEPSEKTDPYRNLPSTSMKYIEEAAPEEASGLVYLATFINPKNHRLFDVCELASSPRHVVVCLPSEHYGNSGLSIPTLGKAYFDRHDVSSGDLTLYRSHSPAGVQIKGEGFGLLLYMGLSTHAAESGAEGIFSEEGRSSSANTLWKSMVRSGIAENGCVASARDEVTLEIPLRSDDIEEALQQYAYHQYSGCDEPELHRYPEEANIEVDVVLKKEIDMLTATAVLDSGLLLTWSDNASHIEELRDQHYTPPNLEVLYELNLDTCFDSSLVLTLLTHIKEHSGGRLDVKRALKLLSTVPPEVMYGVVAGDTDDLREVFDAAPHLRQAYMELAGQTKFDFSAAERQQSLTPNPPKHSAAWREAFGDFLDIED